MRGCGFLRIRLSEFAIDELYISVLVYEVELNGNEHMLIKTHIPDTCMTKEQIIAKLMKDYCGGRELLQEWVSKVPAVIEIHDKQEEAFQWLESLAVMQKLLG